MGVAAHKAREYEINHPNFQRPAACARRLPADRSRANPSLTDRHRQRSQGIHPISEEDSMLLNNNDPRIRGSASSSGASHGWITRLSLAGTVGFLTFAYAQTSAPTNAPSTSLGKIYVHLRLGGLYPKTITVAEGSYEVILSNSAFLAPLDLGLLDASGRTVAQAANNGQFRNRQRVKLDLKPGSHKLQIVGHPAWTADLVVTPKGK
jgi:hypothetical protein